MRMSGNGSGVGARDSSHGFAETSHHFAEASHDFAGADELISDLAALLDAGLVVVHEHVLGPPRYGVARHPAMASLATPR